MCACARLSDVWDAVCGDRYVGGSTNHTVELHNSCGLGVDGYPIIVPNNQVQAEETITIVNLLTYQLFQLLQVILWGGMGKEGRKE